MFFFCYLLCVFYPINLKKVKLGISFTMFVLLRWHGTHDTLALTWWHGKNMLVRSIVTQRKTNLVVWGWQKQKKIFATHKKIWWQVWCLFLWLALFLWVNYQNDPFLLQLYINKLRTRFLPKWTSNILTVRLICRLLFNHTRVCQRALGECWASLEPGWGHKRCPTF